MEIPDEFQQNFLRMYKRRQEGFSHVARRASPAWKAPEEQMNRRTD
jgi:hypothetical protein